MVLRTTKIDSIKLETINNILYFHLKKNKDSVEYYKNLSHQFAKSHYETERNDRGSNVNAWSECECEVNEQWISTYNL